METLDQGSVAGDATIAVTSDRLEFTLTVGQASERFVAAHRKTPSQRSMQRYCIEGRIAAQKIRTTYGSEWLINETSLMQLIEAEPIVTSVASDADAGTLTTPAPPSVEEAIVGAPDTATIGDASAADSAPLATPMGERRTIADVLIQNARLLAEVEGRDGVIAELREDRNFLREEVREARRTRDDVKNIAERMLDTLKTMAIGRLGAPAAHPQEPVHATIIDVDSTTG
ncbi:MAG: hypothetical protein C5B44_03970 [Acidobacteria bacterium]|nr:MAG: hypothetical protein C5B44_03970 [Acidobacteriota bacterium]